MAALRICLITALSLFPDVARSAPVPPAPVPPDLPAIGAAVQPGTGEISERGRERLAQLMAGDASPVAERATYTWLGVLVEFSDRSFPESYSEKLDPLDIFPTIPGDSLVVTGRRDWFLNLMARVDDYFATVSEGAVDIDFVLADSLVRLPRPMDHYGDDALHWVEGGHRLASEVVIEADDDIDFSGYDLVTFIHAGPGQESDLLRDSTEQLWSGYVDFASLTEVFADSIAPDSLVGVFPAIPTADLGGTFILEHFGVAPELEEEEDMDPPFVLGPLGVWVHQWAGFLGLVSLGDYIDPRAQGVGNYDLMGSGLWNALGFVPGTPCAFNRMLMGWETPLTVTGDSTAAAGGELTHLIASAGAPGGHRLFKFPISDREYFLVENRDQDLDGDGAFSFDDANGNHVPDNGESLLGAEFDYFTTQYNSSDVVPGSGLFLWAIDEELIHLTFQFDTNMINGFNDHYGVKLLEADGYPDLSTPGFGSDSYGGDFDAYRAAGGPNGLVVTQTYAGPATLPDTRGAEGADSGWRFSNVSEHGPTMTFTAAYDPITEIGSVTIDGLIPAGDPLVEDFVDGLGVPPLEFLFAATTVAGDSTYLFLFQGDTALPDADGDPATHEPLAGVEGLPAGSPAAADLDGDGLAEAVLLMLDGRLFAWDGAGVALTNGVDPWLARVDSAGVTPMLFDLPGTAAGSEILVAEITDPGGGAPLSTRLRWFGGDGAELAPVGDDADWWAATHAGVPAGDLALGYEVASAFLGPAHADPEFAFFNVALFDSSGGGAGIIFRAAVSALPTDFPPIAERTLTYVPTGDGDMRIASADQDGDGADELLIEAEGELWIWSPAGRYGGAEQGETLFTDARLGGSGSLAIIAVDLDGNGAMEAFAAEASSASRQAAAYGAGAVLLDGWPRPLPQNDPAPASYGATSLWCLAIRDATGREDVLIATRDGRVLTGAALAAAGEPLFVGGNITGSPLLADTDSDGFLELRGISGFERVTGNSSPEDALLSEARLRYWWTIAGDSWPAPAADTGWRQGGADAARSRRVAAAMALELPAGGTARFREAYPYPNPAGASVRWRVLTDGPDDFTVSLYDLEGQLRFETEGACDGFTPWETETNLVGLAGGVYFYTIYSNQSGRLRSGRLAVVR